MIEVIPAILEKDFRNVCEKIAGYVNYTRMIQIDVCDGHFVPTLSWPLSEYNHASVQNILDEIEGLPYWDKVDYEFDLMIQNAYKDFEFYMRLGAKRIVFHIEAMDDKEDFKEFLDALDMYTRDNIQIGLALNIDTDISTIDKFINNFDFLQVMGIKNIGHQGEKFDEKCLDQIKLLKEKYPEVIISVDGGMNEKNARMVAREGVDRIVVGSYLSSSYDIRESIKELQNI